MKVLTRGVLLAAAATVVAAFAMTATSSALTITPINTKVSGNLTAGSSAVFTQPSGTKIVCTTHTVTATTGNGPSVSLLPAGNKYSSSSAATPPKCDVQTSGGATIASATVTVNTTWTLTATSTTSGNITVGNGTVSIAISSILGNCTVTVNASTVPVTLTNNNLSTDANNTVNYTTTGGVCGGAGVATQQETLTFTPPVSVS